MNRLERLRRRLEEEGLDAFLVSTPENRRYLSGFTGTAGYLVLSRREAFLATDFRYIEQAQEEAKGFTVIKAEGDWRWLPELLRELGCRRVGFEGQHITVATYKQLTDALQELPPEERPTLQATVGVVEELRAVKEEGEVVSLKRAIEVADRAFQTVAPTIRPGETEREVAWRLERAIRELGAENISFPIIVASGPNGAKPHHRASDRAIQPGEPIIIDMGACIDGYCSDLTRTLCLGQPDETFRRLYDIVLSAQLIAIATVRAGMTGEQADSLARQVIEEAGYKENFGHSLGHGLGLAVHELPRLGARSSHILKEGMVFTVEPGIYIPGWGGIRIEDVVILEEGGARALTGAPK